jgi:cytidylate kinase
MKSKVIDIMSKKDFSEQVRNTRVHSFSVKPEYFEEELKLKQFFEYYAKWYKCDIDDLKAYIFVCNSKSDREFVKDSIENILPIIQEHSL